MAMVGRGKSTSRSTLRFSDSTRARPSAAVWRFARMVLTSPPEQKWPPAPVRIDARGLVGLDLVEHGRQLAAHDEVQRIAGLRTVQGDRRHRAGALGDQRLVAHGVLLSGLEIVIVAP